MKNDFVFLDFGNRGEEAGYYNFAGPASDSAVFAPTYFRKTFTLTLVQSEEGGADNPHQIPILDLKLFRRACHLLK